MATSQNDSNATFQNIRRSLRLSMNGITADAIKSAVLPNLPTYKQVYGTDLIRIKEITSNYHPNLNVAQMLWQSNVREEMIAATLLFPHTDIPESLSINLCQQAFTAELREQLSGNLIQHIATPHLLDTLTSNNNLNARLCAILTTAFKPHLVTSSISNLALSLTSAPDLPTARVLSRFFRALLHHEYNFWNSKVSSIITSSDANPILKQELYTELTYGNFQ